MNLLDLPDYDISQVEQSTRDYRVHATYKPEPDRCIHCGKGVLFGGKLYRHGSREQLLMDLPAPARSGVTVHQSVQSVVIQHEDVA